MIHKKTYDKILTEEEARNEAKKEGYRLVFIELLENNTLLTFIDKIKSEEVKK
jgi:hypothetical protein